MSDTESKRRAVADIAVRAGVAEMLQLRPEELPTDMWDVAMRAARRAIHDDGRGMIGHGRRHLQERVARMILLVTQAALRQPTPSADPGTAGRDVGAARIKSAQLLPNWDGPHGGVHVVFQDGFQVALALDAPIPTASLDGGADEN